MTDHDTAAVSVAVGKVEMGLLAIEECARAIDERANDGLSPDQVVSIARLIASEAERLQEVFEAIRTALDSEPERPKTQRRDAGVLPPDMTEPEHAQ